MGLASEKQGRSKGRSGSPLLSHTTILILSAFLIGVAAGKAPTRKLEMLLYLAGIFGVVSYFGLGFLAQRRRERSQRKARKKAAKRLESRVSRHIPRPLPVVDPESVEAAEDVNRQYVTVVQAK